MTVVNTEGAWQQTANARQFCNSCGWYQPNVNYRLLALVTFAIKNCSSHASIKIVKNTLRYCPHIKVYAVKCPNSISSNDGYTDFWTPRTSEGNEKIWRRLYEGNEKIWRRLYSFFDAASFPPLSYRRLFSQFDSVAAGDNGTLDLTALFSAELRLNLVRSRGDGGW